MLFFRESCIKCYGYRESPDYAPPPPPPAIPISELNQNRQGEGDVPLPSHNSILADGVPEGVDPSFLAALPEDMRAEVVSEHLRFVILITSHFLINVMLFCTSTPN